MGEVLLEFSRLYYLHNKLNAIKMAKTWSIYNFPLKFCIFIIFREWLLRVKYINRSLYYKFLYRLFQRSNSSRFWQVNWILTQLKVSENSREGIISLFNNGLTISLHNGRRLVTSGLLEFRFVCKMLFKITFQLYHQRNKFNSIKCMWKPPF